MTSKQCTFSQATGEDSLPTSSLDTPQLSLLSGMDMPAKSLENAQQTDGFPACECGRGMSECSIHPNTRDKWIASMQDSLAKMLVLLDEGKGQVTIPEAVYTEKSCVSVGTYDPATCSWKMSATLPIRGLVMYLETFPKWGMMLDGVVYTPRTLVRRIKEKDGLRWPTPNASDSRDRGNLSMPSIQRRKAIGKQLNLSMVVSETSGALNPTWVEWLMGFPSGFTDSKGWVTPKSHSKRL